MQLLPFSMPPFARIQWASKKIKEKYEPMFNLARGVYGILEKESVKHGLRHVTTGNYEADSLVSIQLNLINQGLLFVPIQKVGNYTGVNTYHPPVVQGKPWHFYGVVADSAEYASKFLEHDRQGNHSGLGKLLGYPDCCIDMLETVWKQGYTDPVWQQAIKVEDKYIRFKEDNLIRLKNISWKTNTLLRPFSVGPIFHVKCSITCDHTQKIAEQWIELAKSLKVPGLKEMEMFLRMPMEWDAHRGTAYLKTPLFKASCNSVSSVERYRVQIEGTYFPEDAPTSSEFPWSELFTTVSKNGNKLSN